MKLKRPGVLLPLVLALPLLTPPSSLLAQQALNEVESFLARGMIFGARDRLAEWWENERAGGGRTELQRGIWLRGVLTVDPSLATLDFQRLVLEFPGGPYTDDALLRLAQDSELEGDLPGAARHYRILARDYPASSFQDLAAEWLERNPDAVEALRAQDESGRRGSPVSGISPREAPDPASQQGDISVQLGAFRSLDGARRLSADLRAAGYEARLVRVPGSPLIRVRLGRFTSMEGARDLQEELNRRGFESTVVSDAGEEERAG